MKTVMKQLMYAFIALSLLNISCSSDGDEGPIGPAGVNGVDGVDGQDGMDGNANVQIFEFGERTFSVDTTYDMDGISETVVEESLVLAFYGTVERRDLGNGFAAVTTAWKQVPAVDDDFISKAVVRNKDFDSPTGGNRNSQEMIVSLVRFDGTRYLTPVTFEKFKILVAPSNIAGKGDRATFSKMDHDEIMEYFGLE